jgi:hypothetical protein
LQNELAAQRSKSGGLRRIVWLPEETESKDSNQQSFVERLHQDAETQLGADLITADLETLKGAIHAALQKLEKPNPSKAQRERVPGAPKLVYLMCIEKDRQATIPLRRYLKGCGLEVQIPVFEGDAATVRRANQELLVECDAALLFYGAGEEAWKRTMESDLKKMNGFGREKPLLASYTYLADPATGDKRELIELEEPNLISGLGGFSEATMKPFLDTIQA